jgi:cell fate (sporulation/competence/biofilm development) regulator YlbF (YheA/YmcA/DUF963 family)
MEVDIINAVYDMIDEMKQGKEYQRLLFLHQTIKSNNEINELSQGFKKIEEKYNEAKKYGKYHPDLKKLKLQLQEMKVKLYTNKTVEEYKTLESKLQSQLDEISTHIANAISKQVKHPVELGLIKRNKGGKHG